MTSAHYLAVDIISLLACVLPAQRRADAQAEYAAAIYIDTSWRRSTLRSAQNVVSKYNCYMLTLTMLTTIYAKRAVSLH